DPVRRRQELLHALLLGQPADEEDVRRLVRLADLVGHGDTSRDDTHLACAQRARLGSQGLRRAEDEPGTTHEPAGGPASTPRELDVRPPELDDERPPGRERRPRPGDPGRVYEGHPTRSPAGGRREREEEERQKEDEPGPLAQIPDDSVSVREPEVAERGGRDDRDLHAGAAEVLDAVPDERAGD